MPRALQSFGIACAVVLLAACGGPVTETTTPSGDGGSGGAFSCGIDYLGTKSKDPVLDLTVLGADGASKPLADGDAVPLVFPPQGGRVIFVGVRATNIDPCGATLGGSLIDPATKQLRFDGRTINLVATGDGYGGSADGQIASFSNIPVCPNQWATTDIYGHSFELTVTLAEENTNRTATKSIHVTPFCGEPTNFAECECICKEGYVLGQMCSADAGASAEGGSP